MRTWNLKTTRAFELQQHDQSKPDVSRIGCGDGSAFDADWQNQRPGQPDVCRTGDVEPDRLQYLYGWHANHRGDVGHRLGRGHQSWRGRDDLRGPGHLAVQ